MQARLHPSEYAYILSVLEAERVVGISNDAFFPEDPAARQALLSEGFALLKEHGWFREQDGRISANNTLFLIAAVTAAPELVLSATMIDSEGFSHTVTYYQAEGHTVEQFPTAAGEIMLTLLDSANDITTHLMQALALPERPQPHTLTLPLLAFSVALAAARSGTITPLIDLLQSETDLGHLAQPLAQTIGGLRPAGRIEGAAIQGVALNNWGEIGLLRDQTGQLWLAIKNEEDDTIFLAQGSAQTFTTHLTRLLDALWAAAPVF